MIIEMMAQAAQVPVPKIDPGWTWSATVQVIQLAVGAPIGGGILWMGSKAIALQIDKKNETKKQDSEAASALRGEMMEFNAALQKRIEGLEQTGRDDRKRFDEELASTRRMHSEEVINIRNGYENEIRGLREEIAGLRRQMGQWQNTSVTAQRLSKHAPTSAIKMAEDTAIGDLLRSAYELPSVGEDAGNG